MTTIESSAQLSPQSRIDGFLDVLRCPLSGQRLLHIQGALKSADGKHRYRLDDYGIPLFAEESLSAAASVQRLHYNKIARAYTANLGYPHTQEYLDYLDGVTSEVLETDVGTMVELCCGRGEALILFGKRANRYIGVDISESMLHATQESFHHLNAAFLQADATRVPLAAESVDTVVMLGGIHHVPDRAQLFREIARILKPGGRFVYREPVSDFPLWRGLRAIIYRLSPMLSHETERPLLYEETVPLLEQVGLRSLRYDTYGFIGFCLFMNSDVLFFNRLFRFIPGIRAITRASARLDDMLLKVPGLRRAGLQVVGLAEKH